MNNVDSISSRFPRGLHLLKLSPRIVHEQTQFYTPATLFTRPLSVFTFDYFPSGTSTYLLGRCTEGDVLVSCELCHGQSLLREKRTEAFNLTLLQYMNTILSSLEKKYDYSIYSWKYNTYVRSALIKKLFFLCRFFQCCRIYNDECLLA